MPAKVFVDSNIWLYSLIHKLDDQRHQHAADFVLGLHVPIISSQVIREVCNNLLRKARIPEDKLCALIYRLYQDCQVVQSNAQQHLMASRLRVSYSLSYWDSLIIAAALDANCTTLYSEDMQHGQIIENRLSIINPFL